MLVLHSPSKLSFLNKKRKFLLPCLTYYIPFGIYSNMNKKDEILLKALQLFAAEGYENVGIQKIVEAAEVKKPTLYYYFESKAGLLHTLLKSEFTPLLNELKLQAVYNGDITVSLQNIIATYFNFASSSQDFYRFSLSLVYSSRLSEAYLSILPYIQEQYAILEATFKEAETDHGNMRGRSKRYAITCLGMINSYITSYYLGQTALSEETCWLAAHQFMHGIFS